MSWVMRCDQCGRYSDHYLRTWIPAEDEGETIRLKLSEIQTTENWKFAIPYLPGFKAQSISDGGLTLKSDAISETMHARHFCSKDCLITYISKIVQQKQPTSPAGGTDPAQAASPEAKANCQHLGSFRGETCKKCGVLVQ